MDTIYVPIIKTGKTPKVIACTSDDRFLLVSNWHSYNVSVLEMNGGKYPYAQLKTNIAVPSIPRGMVIDEKTNKTYVAIMGGSTISVIDNKTWTLSGEIKVASNPRHILQDNTARLFVSFNSLAKVGCVNPANGETLFTTNTAAQPRTMALSKDNAYLFVTCYQGNELQVFKIMADRFVLVNKISCPGKPVGVDIYENNDAIEAWVCSYDTGIISVNRFKKMR
jgi:DNA-binding beta-propeller fold protein YncE